MHNSFPSRNGSPRISGRFTHQARRRNRLKERCQSGGFRRPTWRANRLAAARSTIPGWKLAITTSLTLRLVFRLGLRQADGFVASLIRLMGLDLETPDHTTLSRRNSTIDVRPLARTHDGPIHLVIGSTGLKLFGDGK